MDQTKLVLWEKIDLKADKIFPSLFSLLNLFAFKLTSCTISLNIYELFTSQLWLAVICYNTPSLKIHFLSILWLKKFDQTNPNLWSGGKIFIPLLVIKWGLSECEKNSNLSADCGYNFIVLGWLSLLFPYRFHHYCVYCICWTLMFP